jgi:hypothetical protein
VASNVSPLRKFSAVPKNPHSFLQHSQELRPANNKLGKIYFVSLGAVFGQRWRKNRSNKRAKFALIIPTCIFCQYTEPSKSDPAINWTPGVLSPTNGNFSHNFVGVTLLRAFQLFTCVRRDSDNESAASVHRKHSCSARCKISQRD